MSTTRPGDDHHLTTPTTFKALRRSTRRLGAAVAVSVLLVPATVGGPLVATADAQSSALEQSLGGGRGRAVQPVQQRATQPAPTATASEADLNAPADFSGPGIAKGVSLIGWAKAGALVIGVLTLTIGIPASKALKEAGNHHASGIRAGVMSVGGATLLAGVAGTLLPKLMA